MTHPIFPGLERPLLFAHRGASAKTPENTFEAFELALCLGADVLEMDVHLTKDNHPVVIHDATVERTTNGTGLVRDFTLAELQELDAGYRFLAGPSDYRFRGRGVRIETLQATLTNFQRAAFNIELKAPGMVAPVLRAVKEAQAEHVLLTAASDTIMQELEAARPAYPLGMSKGQALSVLKGVYAGGGIPAALHGRALQIPPRYWGVPTVTQRLIDKTRAAGIEMHLWTLNRTKPARYWLGRGVAGIMSDDPGLLANEVINARQRAASQA